VTLGWGGVEIFKKQDIAIYDTLPENVEFIYVGLEFPNSGLGANLLFIHLTSDFSIELCDFSKINNHSIITTNKYLFL
jgi:hypothetical protein